jgi:hypothetical protein
VFSDDREARATYSATQARNELRRRFPLVAVFSGKDGAHAGPTISIHLGRPE